MFLRPVNKLFTSKWTKSLPFQHSKTLLASSSIRRQFHASHRWEVVKPFLLADIGEGITECEIIQWFVEPGAKISEFDKVCEVQSDKASVDISSRYSGTVLKLHYGLNDIAKVGSPLIDIEAEDDDATESDSPVPDTKEQELIQRIQVLEDIVEQEPAIVSNDDHSKVLCIPAVRQLAKEKGIDINKVVGSGPNNRVLKEDILAYAMAENNKSKPSSEALKANDRMEPLNMIQKAMFKSMTRSLAIPQLGYKDDIEVDSTTKYRKALNTHVDSHPQLYPFKKMTYLPIFIKCLSIALSHYPIMNAKLVEGEDGSPTSAKLVYRSSHNIGIAMDTPQGLIVPNIKDVQNKTIFEIASEIHRLTELGKYNSIPLTDLKDGTITISNIGSIGGTYANPVIVSPEMAIVAIGKIQKLPRFDEHDNIVPKQIMPISWSADHRIIDGATIARFGNHWKNLIENPALLASELR
ncbi:2-oxoacid dehydrogenases acyltransferase-domain-containing protein [Pilobolus umbonatus]|nr:2-oxoacid dehydrogenases acyltransferase-domain-containing protein [Pilobolus umbonatus]